MRAEILRAALGVFILGGVGFASSACDNDDPVDAVKDAAHDTGDAVKDAGHDAKDAVKDATN